MAINSDAKCKQDFYFQVGKGTDCLQAKNDNDHY